MHLGIDFGTSNSAMAVADGERVESVLFPDGRALQRTVILAPNEGGSLVYGNDAIEQYYASAMDGRLLQSLKSYLPSSLDVVRIGSAQVRLEDLITRFLVFLRSAARRATGFDFERVVLGRPVVFHAEPERDARAAGRLEAAARAAGFRDVAFQFEPIAAALAYERSIEAEEVVLVGDLGGGTSDFAIVRVGPGRGLYGRASDVLAVSGVPVAGNAFDSAIMRHLLLPWFGRGAPFSLSPGLPTTPWHPQIHLDIVDLYRIPMLKDRSTEDYLRRMLARVDDAPGVQRLHDLIFKDLGFSLAQSIEATKVDLSAREVARLIHQEASLDFDLVVTRAELERVSADVLSSVQFALDLVLARAGVAPNDVRRVFLTGGTSQIPAVRRVFEERFVDRVHTGDVFTSVAQGLALSWPLLDGAG